MNRNSLRNRLILTALVLIVAAVGVVQAFIASPTSTRMFIERVWVVPVVSVILCTVFFLPRPRYYGTVGILFLIVSGVTTFLGFDFYDLRKWGVLFFMFGLFLVFDAIDASRYKDSFIQRVCGGRFSLILVTLIVSFLVGFVMEEWNYRISYWIYPPDNYPLPSLPIFNVPFIVYVGWVIWILALMEMIRVISSLFVKVPFDILLVSSRSKSDKPR